MIKFKMNTIAVWIGNSEIELEQWFKYTNGIENPRRKTPIEKDMGGFIDVDFFVVYITEDNKSLSIEYLVKEISVIAKETEIEIIKAAKEKGILEGNRMYYYYNAEFFPENSDKLYNGLTFIGNFDDEEEF